MRGYKGFTIVELLIVIVVIAILAAVTTLAYNGAQQRAKNTSLQAQLSSIRKKIESYNAETGSYPATQSAVLVQGSSNAMAYVDSGCNVTTSSTTQRRSDWVPSIDMTLPQSSTQTGSRGDRGCFVYQSDGKSYVLSAWNMMNGGPRNTEMYRRVGFRETVNQQYFLCNHPNVGGGNVSPYSADQDYYKYSYTLSNITTCNETPPSGA